MENCFVYKRKRSVKGIGVASGVNTELCAEGIPRINIFSGVFFAAVDPGVVSSERTMAYFLPGILFLDYQIYKRDVAPCLDPLVC